MAIDLNQKRAAIIAIGYECYDRIMGISNEIRQDDKSRTGIQIYVREPGTRNSVLVSIYHPSETAQSLAVEKAVRSETLGDYSSQNSEDPKKMKFRGSLTAERGKTIIQASVSGMQGDEDVYTAAKVLMEVFSTTKGYICSQVLLNGGKLPEALSGHGHYLQLFNY